jgi:hypothetical protein
MPISIHIPLGAGRLICESHIGFDIMNKNEAYFDHLIACSCFCHRNIAAVVERKMVERNFRRKHPSRWTLQAVLVIVDFQRPTRLEHQKSVPLFLSTQ